MKRHLKKVVLAMIAFVLCGVMNVTGSNVSLAATDVETEQTAELEAASTVKHVSARKLYHAGDYLYIETSKGVLAYNMKKQTAKYVVESDGVSGVLVHKGYLYYNLYQDSQMSIYKIKADGSSKPKQICKNGRLGFMKNNRLYYGHSGLCSMKLDGTDKKRHMRVKDDANGKVFYL